MSSGDLGQAKKDVLFVGLTRPAMMVGVTHTFFILNLTVWGVLALLSDNMFFLVAIIPSHFLVREMLRRDIYLADIWIKRFQKNMATPSSGLWQAKTFDTF